MLRKRTMLRSKKNRKKSNRSRVGGRVESLENRRMMFGHGVDDCIDFEDLPAVASYAVGDSFVADNSGVQADFSVRDFQWSSGVFFSGGEASVGNANWAGDAGQEIVINNANVDIDFGGPVEGLSMRVGEYGGNINLMINGDFHNFEDFQDVNGANIGGVTVNVAGGGFGSDNFTVQFDGVIDAISVGGQEFAIDHLCFGEGEQEGRFDWGDAPDQPYPTLQSSFGAYHRINPDVFLGTTVDPDPNGQPNANATGDDADGNDDEDGVRFLTPLVPGQPAEVEVTASTDGFLNAWIDFDSDGTWNGGTEYVFAGEPLSPGANVLTVNVPADAVPARNFSRWRFSTTHKELGPRQSPREETPDGEVEDHRLRIEDTPDLRLDWGDAPDQPYPTLQSSNGAFHVINPDVFLGTTVDADPDGQPDANSLGDDTDGNDDEDGVRFLTPLIPGQPAEVEVTASTEGFLNAWIDYDSSGDWAGAGEYVFAAQPLSAGVNVLTVNIPADAVPARNFSRWRFSTTHKELGYRQSPLGELPDGEVEDHRLRLQDAPEVRLDWGDAPDEPYPTLEANSGARHEINPDVFLGTTIDPESDGQPSPVSQGDDIDTVDDEDGVRFLTQLIPGEDAQVEVLASTDGFLNAWIDFDRDGVWSAAPEKIFEAQPLVAGVNVLTFAVPADAKPAPNDATFSRWRFSTTDRVLTPHHPGGQIPDGEVEDHLAFINEPIPVRMDWGDAPDQPYPTLEASRGARHEINPDVFLGTSIDAEPDGQPNATASGDDLAIVDDEDGVRFLTPLVPGQDARVEVVASTDGFLNAWIDFNRNGIWTSAPEKIFEAEILTAGVNILSFAVPADAEVAPNEPTYSRWRFSTTDRVLLPYHPGGAVPDGEVEDHLALIVDGPDDDLLDFGDAPSRRQGYGFPTLIGEDGARHVINPDIFMGQRIDPDANGQPSLFARADDLNAADDEDGVRFLTPWAPGSLAVTEVLVSTDGFLDAWVDLNQDRMWDPSEQVAVSMPVTAGINHFDFKIPDDAIPELKTEVYSRFRFSTVGGLNPGGFARDGEVEDYARLLGDSNGDGTVDPSDADSLCGYINSGNSMGDLNGDGVVDDGDLDFLIHDVIGTHFGDANMDLVFDSADLVAVFAAGEYEDGIPMNSGWATGDWDCSGDFDTGDLVKAFADGGYVGAATPANLTAAALDNGASNANADDAVAEEGESNTETARQRQLLELVSVDSLFGEDSFGEDQDTDEKASGPLGNAAVDDLFALL